MLALAIFSNAGFERSLAKLNVQLSAGRQLTRCGGNFTGGFYNRIAPPEDCFRV